MSVRRIEVSYQPDLCTVAITLGYCCRGFYALKSAIKDEKFARDAFQKNWQRSTEDWYREDAFKLASFAA